ncbi:kinase-like domain-containing protein [Gymnopilus junonius]|uniref:Kinase-like domain-containing protein n=1 Tax=Gymnopilus junonius TaxID=109634 RepID=A0A9P5N7P5_GYMJU|nr:kinase-like domain-containing protein [Gymnopilus junonius]
MVSSTPSYSSSSPVLISTLPSEETVFFEDTSFFKHHHYTDLPTIAEIEAAALPGYECYVSVFPPLCLAVKRVRITSRHQVSAAEGQTLCALRRFLPEVKVPEVCGWRRDGHNLFIFVEMLKGERLHVRWKDISSEDRAQICKEIGTMVRALSRLKRPAEEEFVGAVGGQPSMDGIIFGRESDVFPNYVEAFYEFFMRIPSSEREEAYANGIPSLPYASPLIFTHDDLNPSNIMITPSSDEERPHVLGVIDWEQSGWMPSFWGPCKLKFWVTLSGDEFRDMLDWLPIIVGEEPEDVHGLRVLRTSFGRASIAGFWRTIDLVMACSFS